MLELLYVGGVGAGGGGVLGSEGVGGTEDVVVQPPCREGHEFCSQTHNGVFRGAS